MQEQRNEIRRVDSIPYVPRSPPPSYKSHTTIERPGIHIIFPRNGEFPESNPPTYRLRNQADRPTILNNSRFIATDDCCESLVGIYVPDSSCQTPLAKLTLTRYTPILLFPGPTHIPLNTWLHTSLTKVIIYLLIQSFCR